MFFGLVLAIATPAIADVRLPHIFSAHMVLQRDRPIPVWGWAAPGESIKITLARNSTSVTADKKGQWRVSLPALPAGGPHVLAVSGRNEITLPDVLVGEVWLCSGQSNMQLPVKDARNPRQEIAAARYSAIRLFTVPNVIAKEPLADCGGSWLQCTPETVGDFSAVAYYFGRELNRNLGVPVGLINASWGGSLCEAWMSRESLTADPGYAEILRRARGDNIGKGCGMYNAMIQPLIPFAVRGVIWYQGESNAARAVQYRMLFPALIADWRQRWGQGDFPFYYVQLAPLDRNRDEWVELQEAQLKTLAVPNTGMVVTHDLDEPGLHPPNKQGVGQRLALWALAKDYGRKGIVYSGPLYKSMKIAGETIDIFFEHGAGLAARDGKPLSYFTIAGEDREFRPAVARIEGDSIVVRSTLVRRPVAVRFGWVDTAQPNLVNGAGLPAAPFRTDAWPEVTKDRR